MADIDRYLPRAFGIVHRRWGPPWVAITLYGTAEMFCALLSQAGATVEGAYELLVSMSIITYFTPFVFLFLATIRLQRGPDASGMAHMPGGRPMAIFLALLGLNTTLVTIVLSVIPAEDDPHKAASIAKVLGSTPFLIGAGVGGVKNLESPSKPAALSNKKRGKALDFFHARRNVALGNRKIDKM